jgi:adenylosuccinate lyase
MNKMNLYNISPVDGRYAKKTTVINEIASEAGLIRYRIWVEVEWFIALSECPEIVELPELSPGQQQMLRSLYENFSSDSAETIKAIEAETNHDVKAIEYFLRKATASWLGEREREFFHFCCTSEDINSTAYALMLKDLRAVLLDELQAVAGALSECGREWLATPLLAQTHGQPASPTTIGKELLVFVSRIDRQIEQLKGIKLLAKMNGAVGNFNAHYVTYPGVDWPQLSREVIERKLGLAYTQLTTQIEAHDYIAELLHAGNRLATIFIDASSDFWHYISRDIFSQRTKDGEVGSSTMPHKVNPIDFENAEGNLLIARSLGTLLADKLPVSRLQRDLTDSTALRNLGTYFAHILIALSSFRNGLTKLKLNSVAVDEELSRHPEVVAEAIQAVMKRYGKIGAYEELKQFTRGRKADAEMLAAFIRASDLPEAPKAALLKLSSADYIGLAKELGAVFLAERQGE